MTARNKAGRTKVVKGCTGAPLYTGGYRGGLTREAALVAQLLAPVEQIRSAYEIEVEALAGELREQFEAGQLYGYRDADPDGGIRALGHVCSLRFALEKLGFTQVHLLLVASPSAEMTDDNWNDVRQHVAEAIAYDVLRVAIERGWHKPTKDEVPSAKALRIGADVARAEISATRAAVAAGGLGPSRRAARRRAR
jgi:hypothetical protein